MVTKPQAKDRFCFKNGSRKNFSLDKSLVFLSRSIDISTTQMSGNVNNSAFYEHREIIYTIILVKVYIPATGSAAKAGQVIAVSGKPETE